MCSYMIWDLKNAYDEKEKTGKVFLLECFFGGQEVGVEKKDK